MRLTLDAPPVNTTFRHLYEHFAAARSGDNVFALASTFIVAGAVTRPHVSDPSGLRPGDGIHLIAAPRGMGKSLALEAADSVVKRASSVTVTADPFRETGLLALLADRPSVIWRNGEASALLRAMSQAKPMTPQYDLKVFLNDMAFMKTGIWAGRAYTDSSRNVEIECPSLTTVFGFQQGILPEIMTDVSRMDGFLDRMIWWIDAGLYDAHEGKEGKMTHNETDLLADTVADLDQTSARAVNDPRRQEIAELTAMLQILRKEERCVIGKEAKRLIEARVSGEPTPARPSQEHRAVVEEIAATVGKIEELKRGATRQMEIVGYDAEAMQFLNRFQRDSKARGRPHAGRMAKSMALTIAGFCRQNNVDIAMAEFVVQILKTLERRLEAAVPGGVTDSDWHRYRNRVYAAIGTVNHALTPGEIMRICPERKMTELIGALDDLFQMGQIQRVRGSAKGRFRYKLSP